MYELGPLVGRHVVPGSFYVASTLPESGGTVEWMLRLLNGDEEDLSRWTEQAQTLSPGEGGVFLPRLDDEDSGLVPCVLSKDSDPAYFLRALLEGLTLQIDAGLKHAARAAGVELKHLTLVGGGAENALWRQLKADASGLSVHTVSDPQCVARGAAMLAGVGIGVFEDYDSVPAPDHEPYVHEPSGERPTYEQLYSEVHQPLRKQLGAVRSAWRETRGTP
jgi:xylulokinase